MMTECVTVLTVITDVDEMHDFGDLELHVF